MTPPTFALAAVLATAAALAAPSTGHATDRPAATTRNLYVSGVFGSDTNNGRTPTSPFKTIQHAADLTRPGDTVNIMKGVYSEAAPWNPTTNTQADVVAVTRSGRPGAPITYRNYAHDRPVIYLKTGWNAFNILGVSYVNFIGLEVKGNTRHLNLADAENNASRTVPTYNGNCLSASTVTANDAAHHPELTVGQHPHHLVFRNLYVHDCPGGGIAVNNGDYITVDHNTVHSNAWYSVFANSGISVKSGIDVDDATTDYKNRVTGNISYDNEAKVQWLRPGQPPVYSDGNGIIIDYMRGDDHQYRGRTLVANNLTVNNGGSGIHSYHSDHVDIVNNTAYLNSRSPHLQYSNIYAADSRNVRVLDNISVARSGKPTNTANKNQNVIYDYNTYFGGLTPEVVGPHDTTDQSPGFVRPKLDPYDRADFRPAKGSPVIDSGTAVPEVTTDLIGTPRPQGAAPDRGAYEYVCPPKHSSAS